MSDPKQTYVSRADVFALIRKAGAKGMTIPEVIRSYPEGNAQSVRAHCRTLLDKGTVHRIEVKRGKAWVMLPGKDPSGAEIRRPRLGKGPTLPLMKVLRDIQKALNRRELVGEKAAHFSRVIGEQLARRGVSDGKSS